MLSRKTKIYLSIVAISFLQGLQYVVSPVLGAIQAYYPQVDVSMVQMLVTAPALLSMLVALVSGWMVRVVSKKKLLLFSAFLSGLTGFLPYLSDSFALLFASRVLYGAGLGIASTMNLAVVAEYFEGDERVKAMGVQSASIGLGMVVITALAGFLGRYGFRATYPVNALGFAAMLVLWTCLPDSGRERGEKGAMPHLNSRVLGIDAIGVIQMCCIMAFSTNIAIHLSGALTGDSAVSGMLSSCFSGGQIVMGFCIAAITRMTKRFTLPVSMLSFALGAVILALSPASVIPLVIGATLCGFAQGLFVPTASTGIANAVDPDSTAFASATFTFSINLGPLSSPTVLNGLSKLLWGQVSTVNVFWTAALLSTLLAVVVSGVLILQARQAPAK